MSTIVYHRASRLFTGLLLTLCLSACSTGPLVGLLYTDVRLPLTTDLRTTPAPKKSPSSDRVIEIKEPISGLGLYARVSTNAIGEVARRNGVDPLYFADQEIFSILGIWKTHRVYLYGEPIPATTSP
ncbi:hypothetical protein [Desulfosarcina ovata]|uniref:Uncharacterized protein n=1 Tax=Desulfosarcina ovata subsp. ovata TaxID=2752305 RepID=A0A5K8A8T0_9BACT|nr:hypothetical protein [Desulfosarcina ovata]BBO88937.1 hypothetical protein DSCOOX_21170 [Desulfosarcina ovata subsp. ovata]